MLSLGGLVSRVELSFSLCDLVDSIERTDAFHLHYLDDHSVSVLVNMGLELLPEPSHCRIQRQHLLLNILALLHLIHLLHTPIIKVPPQPFVSLVPHIIPILIQVDTLRLEEFVILPEFAVNFLGLVECTHTL